MRYSWLRKVGHGCAAGEAATAETCGRGDTCSTAASDAKDWENGYFQRPLKAGEVMRTVSFGLYEVKDRKFRHIRAARYKQIHDWRMEPV